MTGEQSMQFKFSALLRSYQNTAMPTSIYLLIIYGCFCTTVVGSSNCSRICMACKAENIYFSFLFSFSSFLFLLFISSSYKMKIFIIWLLQKSAKQLLFKRIRKNNLDCIISNLSPQFPGYLQFCSPLFASPFLAMV